MEIMWIYDGTERRPMNDIIAIRYARRDTVFLTFDMDMGLEVNKSYLISIDDFVWAILLTKITTTQTKHNKIRYTYQCERLMDNGT